MTDFDEYVAAASPRLVRAARLLVGDSRTAEDLAQETLVQMYRHWQRIQPHAVHAYAHRTLVRLAHRHIQRRPRHVELTDAVDQAAPGCDVPELVDEVRTALLTLPARQREALVLRYFLDLSITDTATAMGCDPGTVKSQCSKGLGHLREALDTLPIHAEDAE